MQRMMRRNILISIKLLLALMKGAKIYSYLITTYKKIEQYIILVPYIL